MEMNHYILSDLLLEVRRRLAEQDFTEESATAYFKESVACIHQYFMNTAWREKYLFCSFGFLDRDKAILTPYQFNTPILGEYHENLMRKLTDWINDDGLISITKMFLDNRTVAEHYKALLYSNNIDKVLFALKQFIYVNLKSLGWEYAGNISAFERKFSGPYQPYDFYKSFSRNLDGSDSNPFLKITDGKPTAAQKKQFDKLIGVFAEIATGLKDASYFYFFKPVTFQNHSNVVLLLGLKQELNPDEIEFWIDKTRTILSIIADKAVESHAKVQAQIELLQGISADTHTTQTTINTLFSAPLNSLKADYPNDVRVKQLTRAKDFLLSTGNLGNLLSKLGITGDGDGAKETILEKSKLFTTTGETINIKKLMLSKLEVFNQDKSGNPKIIIPSFVGLESVGKRFFQFRRIFAAEIFFEIILLTVIENCSQHANSTSGVVHVEISISEDKIVFSNQMKPHARPLNGKPASGNFLVINNILNRIDAGAVKFQSRNNTFSVIVNSKTLNNG